MRDSQTVSYIVTGLVIVLVLALRFRRVGQLRPLRLERLWVAPVIYFIVVVGLVGQSPPADLGWLWCAGALVLGAIIGWYRGKAVTITVDPGTHALNQTSSVAGMIFLVALIAIRYGLRTVLAGEAASWHVSAATLVDAFLLLARGLIAVQRLEMFLRARRLLVGTSA